MRLTGAAMSSAEDVVGWLGAVQSQDYPYARWSIGQRTAGVTSSDVDAALADGTIVRTHILRPTWHLVLPADLRWMMALTGPRVERGTRVRKDALGLGGGVLERATDAVVAALRGRRLTRAQLAGLLADAGLEHAASAGPLAYVLMHAELHLLICSGGLDGRQQTYALVEDRVPAAAALSAEEALVALVRRYFRSHGPSSIADFTWWSSLTVTDARRALESLDGELEQVVVDGRVLWFDPAASSGADRGRRVSAQLLQAFDEYVVGYQRTRGVIDADRLSGPGTWNPNSFIHPIVLDGQIAGGWKRVAERDGIAVRTRLLRPLGGREREAVEAQVERYGAFLGERATVAW